VITKDQSIVTQVAAKIASELAVKAGDRNIEHLISDWSIAYEAVNEELFKMHSFQGADAASDAVIKAFPGSTVVAGEPTNQVAYSLEVAGTQHGDLPSWLIDKAREANVRRVWDNRDKAVGTKRPWFKQADNQDGTDPVAFWPPK
jgi:hypothetical protein